MMSLRARGLRAAQRAILFLSTFFPASFSPPLFRRVSQRKTESIPQALRLRGKCRVSLLPRNLSSGFSAKRVYSTPCG
jgi:hypothetical protein